MGKGRQGNVWPITAKSGSPVRVAQSGGVLTSAGPLPNVGELVEVVILEVVPEDDDVIVFDTEVEQVEEVVEVEVEVEVDVSAHPSAGKKPRKKTSG